MKKLFVLILALCLVLALTACGGSAETPATDAPKTEAPETEAPKTEAPKTEAPATEAPATEAPATDAPATEAPAEQKTLAHGTVEGNVYTNESLNLKFTAPDGYTFYGDEELATVNNMLGEYFDSVNMGDLLKKNGYVIDMYVADAGSNNVNLTVQPYDKSLDAYDDEELFTLLEPTYKAQFSAAGMTINSFEVVKTNAFGKDTYAAAMELTANGTTLTEYQILLRGNSEYYGILTFAAQDASEIQNQIDALSHIN